MTLSCYTANLVSYLRVVGAGPESGRRLAEAIRLAIRIDLPDGRLAFSHHRRVDRVGGYELTYLACAGWDETRAMLAAEIARVGAVLAVANTKYLAWSPNRARIAVPHWIVLRGHAAGRWQVNDDFTALMPGGSQHPYAGELDDDTLRTALTPVGPLPPAVYARDRYALGAAVPVPPVSWYRWLARRTALPERPESGAWQTGTDCALNFLAIRLTADPSALDQHTEDVWAAARHHEHRLAELQRAGRLPAEPAQTAARSWSQLPRALRFAADSARRGRPRPAVVQQAFREVIESTAQLPSATGTRNLESARRG